MLPWTLKAGKNDTVAFTCRARKPLRLAIADSVVLTFAGTTILAGEELGALKVPSLALEDADS